jgi:hypothetical protein
MGSTCASVHFQWRGTVGDAAKAISRAYTKLGYERTKKPPAEGGKQVFLVARLGANFVSVYDSTNADLDSGELKDVALAASKLLKTGALFTSLYDSDTYELAVFGNGRQVDLLLSDAESYSGPLKRLSGKARATQWSRIFARNLTAESVEQAANVKTAFANSTLVALCGLLGLPGERPQMQFSDFGDEPELIAGTLYFTKKTVAQPAVGGGEIVLRNYFDPDNSRKLLVYPASWPMPLQQEQLLTWLMLSEGAGFKGGTATIEVTGPDGLIISKGFMNGAKFHNGQIVGGYELAKDTPVDVAKAYLETKRFVPTQVGAASANERCYAAEYPNLWVPPMTPERTTQILVVLQLYVTAAAAGEWEVKVTLQPDSGSGYRHELPPAGVAGAKQGWLPVVSGLNPKARYRTGDLVDGQLPDHVMDSHVRRTVHRPGLDAAETRAWLESQNVQGRDRAYKDWLYDLNYKQGRVPNERLIDHNSVASNVAILPDHGQGTLDGARAYLEDWLRPCIGKGGEIRVRAEKHMSESCYVGKMKKTLPASSALGDKAWGKLFEYASDYQAVVIEVFPEHAEFPIAGAGLNYSFHNRTRPAERRQEAAWAEHDEYLIGLTLGKMRGRPFGRVPRGHALHLYNWCINHDNCLRQLDSSPDDMIARLDAFAPAHAPLQAWHGQATWIPKFDRADDYEDTIYESMSVLNFFRGILFGLQDSLKQRRMTAPWCANVLRMVAPHMWLCRSLIDQVDRAKLERAAIVTEVGESCKIEKRPDCGMDDLELALLNILPIESARMTIE